MPYIEYRHRKREKLLYKTIGIPSLLTKNTIFHLVAKRVVATEIIIQGEIVDVELVDTEAGFWKKKSGTVLVSGLHEGITENHVHIHFQRKKNGGGEVKKLMLLPGKKAMVVFEDIQGLLVAS
jgi:hypothetical protein